VKSSTRKWVITGIEIAFAGVVLWSIPRALEYFRIKAVPDRMLRYSRRGEAVDRLLKRTDAAVPRLDGTHPCVSIDVSHPHPQLGKCATPTTHSGPVDRFEVDLRYGNLVLRQSDLYLNDVFDVPLTRSYNSGDYLLSNPVHAFGRNTNHPYDWSLAGHRNPYTYTVAVLEDGDFLYFPRVSQGVGYADAIFQHAETSTVFYKSVIAWNGDGWTLFREDGSTILFPEAYNAKSAAQGAPYGMRDVAGNVLELLRDLDRNLIEIRTPHGRWIRFRYDGKSRIVRAADDQGHSVQYLYDSNGMLTEARTSSGGARHYTYDGDLMTVISDDSGQVLLRNSYDGRWVVRQDFGNGEIFRYTYDFYARGNGQSYADRVTVIFPDGRRQAVELSDSVPDVRKHPPR
jgi:YD repeat-containing protein